MVVDVLAPMIVRAVVKEDAAGGALIHVRILVKVHARAHVADIVPV